MINNPIVDDVHYIREQMLAEYNGDLHALIQDARRRTEEAARAGKKIFSPLARHSESVSPATEKAG